MSFANPIWFWTLLALLIPLLIHLLNRGKRKAIPFGSLLWLPQANHKLNQQIQFNHWWLWLVKSLIFVLLSVLIAQPYIKHIAQNANKHLLLIEPTTPPHILQQIEDTLALKNWEAKWLSYNLPAVNFDAKPIANLQKAGAYDLLQLINSKPQKPLSATVVGKFNASDFKGKKLSYDFPVDWILLPKAEQTQTFAYLQTAKSLNTLSLNEQNRLTKIRKNEVLQATDTNLSTIKLDPKNFVIVYDEQHQNSQKATFAALKALESYYAISFKIESFKRDDLPRKMEDEKELNLFWLSKTDLPILAKSTQLFLLDINLPKGTFVPINEDKIEWNAPSEDQKLPYFLNKMLFQKPAIDQQLAQLDSRPIHPSFFVDKNYFVNIPLLYTLNQSQSLNFYIWGVILLLIMVERYINSKIL